MFVLNSTTSCHKLQNLSRETLAPAYHLRCTAIFNSAASSGNRKCSPAVRKATPSRKHRSMLPVMAVDAAQPFDLEHKLQEKLRNQSSLRIGIVGFGNFGQFIAKRMVQQGHQVLATSRTPYYEEARSIGAEFFEDIDDFCEEHPDVVILASSILSTEKVLRSIPLQRLKRSTLFVDVLSVKVFPKQLLLSVLPSEMDILCTHPMFGPDSGRGSWSGLNFMFEKVRVGADSLKQARCDAFLAAFQLEGCRMVEMTCEEHDRQAASTQFITHTVGRILGAMQLQSTAIDTKGYEALLNLVNNTANDSFDLYYGLFLYNQNATDELERLERAFDQVKKQLFGRLHDIARQQLVPSPPSSPIRHPIATTSISHPHLPSPALHLASFDPTTSTIDITAEEAAASGSSMDLPTTPPPSSQRFSSREAAAQADAAAGAKLDLEISSLTAELLSVQLQAAASRGQAAGAGSSGTRERVPM